MSGSRGEEGTFVGEARARSGCGGGEETVVGEKEEERAIGE